MSTTPSSDTMPLHHLSRRITFRHIAIVAFSSLLLFTIYSFSSLGNPRPGILDEYGDRGRPRPPHAPRPPAPPTDDDAKGTSPKTEWAQRAQAVKEAFLYAYRGYERYAAPHDELLPVSGGHADTFNGWAVSMHDSLSTMLLMGLDDEFSRALKTIEKTNFTLPHPVRGVPVYIPFFETVIRHLGGLLSAYAYTHEPVLLRVADELATKLAPVFNTTSGLPAYGVDPDTGAVDPRRQAVGAEIGSCQLEYAYLARVTGKKEHYDRTASIMKAIAEVRLGSVGMLAQDFDLTTGQHIKGHISVGAASDSLHEYLLKLYLLTGQTDKVSLDLYIQTINRVLTTLLYVSPNRGLLYVTDAMRADLDPIPTHKFEHLSCFLPGLIALGAHTLPDNAFDNARPMGLTPEDEDEIQQYNWKELHMIAAQGLAETCIQLYEDQPTGLGPEEVQFKDDSELWIRQMRRWRLNGKKGNAPGIGAKKRSEVAHEDYTYRKSAYLLRPETLESVFLLWKITGDETWRERGWTFFQALQKHTQTQYGYSSVMNVIHIPVKFLDEMPSYFLAETLKYLYLLFSDEDLVPLDRWVFNTEAHPLPIIEWTPWERRKFKIPS